MTNYRLLTLAGALAYVAVGISSPLMTLFLESLGASYSQISLVLTSYVVALLAFSYLWGRLSDRLQRRKPFVAGGLLGMAIAYGWLGVVPTLAGALKDKEADVRLNAAAQLRNLGPGAKTAVKELIAALKDPDDDVRVRVAQALEAIGADAQEAVPALKEAAKNDKDDAARQAAADALERITRKEKK